MNILRVSLPPLPERAVYSLKTLCNEHYGKVPMLYGPIGRALDDTELFSLRLRAEQQGASLKVKALPTCELDIRGMSRRTLRRVLEECLTLRVTFEIVAEQTTGFDRACASAAVEWTEAIYGALKNEGVDRKDLADASTLN